MITGKEKRPIEKTIESIRRNAEKINQYTWKVYKEQILAHIEDAEFEINESTPPSPDIDNLIEGEVALKAIKKDLQELAKRAIDQNAKIVYGMAYVICEVHLKIKPNKEPNVQECDATEPE